MKNIIFILNEINVLMIFEGTARILDIEAFEIFKTSSFQDLQDFIHFWCGQEILDAFLRSQEITQN